MIDKHPQKNGTRAMPLPSKFYAIMDGMETFVRSIPGERERCIAGEQGYAFWPGDVRDALDAGPDTAAALGLTITSRSANEWKAVYYFDGVASDGSPARLEFRARLENRKDGPVVAINYWRRWNSALRAEQAADSPSHH